MFERQNCNAVTPTQSMGQLGIDLVDRHPASETLTTRRPEHEQHSFVGEQRVRYAEPGMAGVGVGRPGGLGWCAVVRHFGYKRFRMIRVSGDVKLP